MRTRVPVVVDANLRFSLLDFLPAVVVAVCSIILYYFFFDTHILLLFSVDVRRRCR